MFEDKKARVDENNEAAPAGLNPDSPEETDDEQSENGEEASGAQGLTEERQFEGQIQELQDKLLRTAAEFDNYKKRVARQYDDMMQAANDKLLFDLVEIADNFDRALQHTESSSNAESLRQGFELIHAQIGKLLAKYSVTPIEAVGKPFDPHLHDALMQVESEEYDEGIVALEMSKGYMRGEKVLRHSKVGVSKGK